MPPTTPTTPAGPQQGMGTMPPTTPTTPAGPQQGMGTMPPTTPTTPPPTPTGPQQGMGTMPPPTPNTYQGPGGTGQYKTETKPPPRYKTTSPPRPGPGDFKPNPSPNGGLESDNGVVINREPLPDETSGQQLPTAPHPDHPAAVAGGATTPQDSGPQFGQGSMPPLTPITPLDSWEDSSQPTIASQTGLDGTVQGDPVRTTDSFDSYAGGPQEGMGDLPPEGEEWSLENYFGEADSEDAFWARVRQLVDEGRHEVTTYGGEVAGPPGGGGGGMGLSEWDDLYNKMQGDMVPQDYGYVDTFLRDHAGNFQTGIDAMKTPYDTSPWGEVFSRMQMGMTPQDYGYLDTFMRNQADRFRTGIDAMRNKFDTSPYETMFGMLQGQMTPQDYGYLTDFMRNQADQFQTGINTMRNKFDTDPWREQFSRLQGQMTPQDYGYLADFLGDTASRFETGIEAMKTPYDVDPWKTKFGELTDSMTGPDYTGINTFLSGLETSLGDKRDEINVDPDFGVQEEAILSLLNQIQGPDMSGITEGLGNIWDAAEGAMGKVAAASDPTLSRYWEGVGPDNIISMLDNYNPVFDTSGIGAGLEGIKSAFGNIGDPVASVDYTTDFANLARDIGDYTPEFDTSRYGDVLSGLSSAWEGMKGRGSEAMSDYIPSLQRLAGEIEGYQLPTGPDYSGVTDRLGSAVTNLLGMTPDDLSDFTGTQNELIDLLSSQGEGLIGSLGGRFDKGLSGLGGRFDESLAGLSAGLDDRFNQFFSDFTNKVQGGSDDPLMRLASAERDDLWEKLSDADREHLTQQMTNLISGSSPKLATYDEKITSQEGDERSLEEIGQLSGKDFATLGDFGKIFEDMERNQTDSGVFRTASDEAKADQLAAFGERPDEESLVLGNIDSYEDYLNDPYIQSVREALDLANPFDARRQEILSGENAEIDKKWDDARENLENRFAVMGNLGSPAFAAQMAELESARAREKGRLESDFQREAARTDESVRSGRLSDLVTALRGEEGRVSRRMDEQDRTWDRAQRDYQNYVDSYRQAYAQPRDEMTQLLNMLQGFPGSNPAVGSAIGGLGSAANFMQDRAQNQAANLFDAGKFMFGRPDGGGQSRAGQLWDKVESIGKIIAGAGGGG